MIAEESFPYLLMHVKAQPETFDLKLTADMRKFFFKPQLEDEIYEKLKSLLWSTFNKMQVQYEPKSEAYCRYISSGGHNNDSSEKNTEDGSTGTDEKQSQDESEKPQTGGMADLIKRNRANLVDQRVTDAEGKKKKKKLDPREQAEKEMTKALKKSVK